MTWDKGFNFRATSTFVTDGTNETYVLAESYPTTRNGVTFGYASTGSLNTRDRSSAVDRRLAGVHFDVSVAPSFRVDLPAAGAYSIRLASGDQGNSQTVQVSVKDGATTLISVGPTALTSAHALDAAGAVYSDAAWPTSNSAVNVTFAGSVLTFTGPITTGTGDGLFEHLFVSQVTSGPTYTLSPATGAFALTGDAAPLTAARTLRVTPGAFAVTGTTTPLAAARKVPVATGAYSLTGTATPLATTRKLPVTTGAIALTGITTPCHLTRRIVPTTGAFSVSGSATPLQRVAILSPSVGAYVVTGHAATLAKGTTFTLAVSTGAFTVSGNAAGLVTRRVLAPASGAMQLAGLATPLRVAHRLGLTPGSYLVTGHAATLGVHGAATPVRVQTVLRPRYGVTTVLQPRYRITTLLE